MTRQGVKATKYWSFVLWFYINWYDIVSIVYEIMWILFLLLLLLLLQIRALDFRVSTQATTGKYSTGYPRYSQKWWSIPNAVTELKSLKAMTVRANIKSSIIPLAKYQLCNFIFEITSKASSWILISYVRKFNSDSFTNY